MYLTGKDARAVFNPLPVAALDELTEDANERKACVGQNYRELLRRRSRTSRHACLQAER
jgi:hypothetical protein